MSNLHPADDLSIAEHGGHIKGRPISWVVVVLVCGGFIAAGIGLTIPTPWLAWVGLGVVAVATILGGLTHAMGDQTFRVETKARRENAAEPEDRSPATESVAEDIADERADESADQAEAPANS